MPWPLITQAQLENRLSATVVRRIYDDDNNGTADAAPVALLLLDASSKVAGALGPVYPIDTIREMDAAELPGEVVRIALDVAHAMAAQRHPEFVKGDWVELMKAADRDLKMVRDTTHNLGVTGDPEPPTNTASVVGGLGRGSLFR